MTSKLSDMMSLSNFFDVALLLFSNLVTSPSFMSISQLVLELWQFTRNSEIGNTSVWVLPTIWRLGQVRNTKFGTNVSIKMLLNVAKCQGCRINRFWVIKGKPTGKVKLTLSHTQIRVKKLPLLCCTFHYYNFYWFPLIHLNILLTGSMWKIIN